MLNTAVEMASVADFSSACMAGIKILVPVPLHSVTGRMSLIDVAVMYGEHISKLGKARPIK